MTYSNTGCQSRSLTFESFSIHFVQSDNKKRTQKMHDILCVISLLKYFPVGGGKNPLLRAATRFDLPIFGRSSSSVALSVKRKHGWNIIWGQTHRCRGGETLYKHTESSETTADQSTWGQCSRALRSYTMPINLRSRLWRWALKNQWFMIYVELNPCGIQRETNMWRSDRRERETRATCMCFNWCFSSVCLQIVTVKQQNKRRPSVCSSADSESEDLLPVLIDHSQILNEYHLEQVGVLLWN